jgi:hypothetical protein
LKNRWSDKIQREVNKFIGCVNQIENKNLSGTTKANRFTMAMNMFSSLYEKPFGFLACYKVLSTLLKWNDYCCVHDKKNSPSIQKKNEETHAPSISGSACCP